MARELDDMAARAEAAGYTSLAAGYRKDAQTIRDAGGPEYFSANSAQTRTQELVLPEPSPVLIEVHRMLTDSGFTVAPTVYVDKQKGEVTHGLIETVVRPDYTDGTQMYYSNPDEDPLAGILEKGRTGQQKRIAVPDWARHVPTKSRFAVSWDEVHNFVAPEVVNTTPHLKEQVTKSGIVFRVPTKSDFQSAGKDYPHLGGANTWEWLYDKARFHGGRLIGGDRDDGGLGAVYGWPPGAHGDDLGFCLQVVSRPQKLPR